MFFQNFLTRALGFKQAYSSHDQKAYYGLRKYDVNHQSLYTHLLFNSILGNTLNKFKVGLNYTHDLYDEAVDLYSFDRKDLNWGGYFEYTYNNDDNFSWIGGLRVDIHNNLGHFCYPSFSP